jgi:hypothetical protein
MKLKLPFIDEKITQNLTYKILLILILLIIMTIVIYKFTFYVDSLKYEKSKCLKQDRINKFMEEFKNTIVTEGFDDLTLNEINPNIDDVWQKDTLSFSFNNSGVFNKKYGVLDEKNESIIEGFDFFNANDWNNAFDPKKNGIASGVESGINESYDKIIKPIQDWIQENVVIPIETIVDYVDDFENLINKYVIDPITNEFNNIVNRLRTIAVFITEIRTRFIKLGDSIIQFGTAIGDTFVTIFEAIQTEAVNIGNLIYGGGKCLVHFTQNFRSCFIYWILDAIGELIYSLFVLLPIWFIEAITGLNIMYYLDKLTDIIEYIDSVIFKNLNFSFIHYPQSILNDCYLCNGVDFNKMVTTLNDDNSKIRGSFQKLEADYETAAANFIAVFN